MKPSKRKFYLWTTMILWVGFTIIYLTMGENKNLWALAIMIELFFAAVVAIVPTIIYDILKGDDK